jgi:hypothetical protein
LAPSTILAASLENDLARANQLELDGRFTEASAVLKHSLAEDLSPALRRQTEFEFDRLMRIRRDFSLTREALFTDLQQSVRGLTRNEFDQWVRDGRFDSRPIDGQQWFMHSSVSNLFFRYPELNSRRLDAQDDSAAQKSRLQLCRAIRLAALRQGKPYVLPKRLDATMSVTVHANAVPAGQIIRAWLPIPREYPYQNDFELVSSFPPAKEISPANSPIRSVYFEQPAQANAATRFTTHFRYTRYGVSFDIDPKKVTPFDGKDASIAPFIREAPHVVFTPEMRALSRQIVGNEKNPAVIAKTIYDWIGSNIQYSYAIEYSTIRNISDYVRSRRCNNIPARWQTGWDIFPGEQDIHDWSEIYLAPYGWVPIDPCLGLLAKRYMTALSLAERQELHNFYFGGLDPWRMAANGDHSQILTPPKKSFRSDNVDFQRGELESGGENIYFNHYNYQFNVTEVPATPPH